MLDYTTRVVNHTNETITLKLEKRIYYDGNYRWILLGDYPLKVLPGKDAYIRSSELEEIRKKEGYEVRFKIYSDNEGELKECAMIGSNELNENKVIFLRHKDDGTYLIDSIPGLELDITRSKWYILRCIPRAWSSKTRFKNYTNTEIFLKRSKVNSGTSEDDGTVTVPAGRTNFISSSMLEGKGKMSEKLFEFKIFSGDEELDCVIESGTLAKGKEIVLVYGNEAGKYLLFTYLEAGKYLLFTYFEPVVTHVKRVSSGESGTSSPGESGTSLSVE